MQKQYPYIAIIEDFYKASTGNYLCREKGKDLTTHPYDWPIFIDGHIGEKMQKEKFPIYGLIVMQKAPKFRNGERITCISLSYDLQEITDELNDSLSFDKEI